MRISRRSCLAFAAGVLLALSASAEVTVVNGVRYVCEDGVCRLADEDAVMPGEEAAGEPSAATGGRLGQGYMDADELLGFLAGGESAADAEMRTLSLGLVLLLAILGGLAMNLTPCVLPLVPVNLMIIGRSVRRGAWYALGIAIAYGTLGLLAAVGGLAFGVVQSSPWFNAAVAAVFAALALALAGVWRIDFSRFRPRGGNAERRLSDGFAFVSGVMSAVLAGACVGPILVSVLLLTADRFGRGDWAALALPFAVGVGMALPWPLVGAGLRVLPRPGAWMRWVNRAFAAVVAVLALYYGRLAVVGFSAGAGAGRQSDGVLTAVPKTFERTLADAARPVFVDCWASWCKNCAAMDRAAFADPRVRKVLSDYTVIRLCAEDLGELRALPGFGEVRGLPAFMVIE